MRSFLTKPFGTSTIAAMILSLTLLSACTTESQLSEENRLIDFKYDQLMSLPNHLFLAKNHVSEKYDSFLVDQTGNVLYQGTSAEIEPLPIFWEGNYYYIVKKDGKKGLINEQGTEIFPIIFEDSLNVDVNFSTFLSSDSNLVPFAKTEGEDIDNRVRKWGYLDKTNGEIVIQPTYDRAYPFRNGTAKVMVTSTEAVDTDWGDSVVTLEMDDWMYLFIDESGTVVGRAPGKNEEFTSDNGYFPKQVRSEEREYYSSLFDQTMTSRYTTYVFANREGNVLDSREFLGTTGFYKGHAYVRYENEQTWSVLDESGGVVQTDIPIEGNDLVFVEEGGYYKLLDSRDHFIIKGFYNERGEKLDEAALYRIDRTNRFPETERWGELHHYKQKDSGETVFYDMALESGITLPAEFSINDIYQYDREYLYAAKEDTCYLIDQGGQTVLQSMCKDQRLVGKLNDTPVFTKDRTLFYENGEGKKFSYSFDSAESIGNGRYLVSKEGKMGVVQLALE